jgi:hypothetical protein
MDLDSATMLVAATLPLLALAPFASRRSSRVPAPDRGAHASA